MCILGQSCGTDPYWYTEELTEPQGLHDTPDILELPKVTRALKNELTHIQVKCLAEGHCLEQTNGDRHCDTILARFVEFLEAHSHRPTYLTEICAAIGVAERTLRACCERHLGMGPIRYLTLRRMHLVRRALRHSDPSKATVTQIVTDHGFWELGRFSGAYRALFGEPPSETLRQPTWQTRNCRPMGISSLAVART